MPAGPAARTCHPARLAPRRIRLQARHGESELENQTSLRCCLALLACCWRWPPPALPGRRRSAWPPARATSSSSSTPRRRRSRWPTSSSTSRPATTTAPIFHRVIPNFMIQGGGMKADMQEKPTRAPIPLESRNGLNNLRGTVAMARTARSQLGHRAVLHQRQGQRLPRRGQLARRQRLRRVRQGGSRHGRGRQDPGRAHGQQGPVPERAGEPVVIRKATLEK